MFEPKLVIWKKGNGYYYKLVKGSYARYYVGYKNQYNHEVILIIENVYFYKPYKISLKKKCINRIVRFLQKL